ncbi:MAG: flagellar protein FlaG [Xanthomonadales bacterium]|nr:flagellar protein FlaG [Xanthomonadales bacterium]
MNTINPLLSAYSPAAASRSSGASAVSGAVQPATSSATPAGANALPAQALQANGPNAPKVGAQEREPAAGRPDKEDLQRQLDEVMKGVQTSLRFRVDDDSNRVVVSIVDQTSGDVIQQIPSEVSLRIAKRMAELGSGMINESA